jgi:hypothetical protein
VRDIHIRLLDGPRHSYLGILHLDIKDHVTISFARNSKPKRSSLLRKQPTEPCPLTQSCRNPFLPSIIGSPTYQSGSHPTPTFELVPRQVPRYGDVLLSRVKEIADGTSCDQSASQIPRSLSNPEDSANCEILFQWSVHWFQHSFPCCRLFRNNSDQSPVIWAPRSDRRVRWMSYLSPDLESAHGPFLATLPIKMVFPKGLRDMLLGLGLPDSGERSRRAFKPC